MHADAEPLGSTSKQQQAPMEPSRKKQKPANPFAKVRGKLGLLKKFNDIPLDLVAEICSHLDHETLLTLTLTSRAFRSILLLPSSKWIWTMKREEAKLPELESMKMDDMTEVQYANLVWGKCCAACGKKNIKKVNYALRVRFCPSCLPKKVCNSQFVLPDGKRVRDIETWECSIRSLSIVKHYHYIEEAYTRDVLELHAEMTTRFYSKPGYTFVNSGSFRMEEHSGITWADERAFVIEYPDAERIGFGPVSEKIAFLHERKEYAEARRRDADALDKWARDWKKSKEDDKDVIRTTRRTEMERRLTEEDGYDADDFNDYRWKHHKLVNEPKLLTDRTWKTVQPKLIPFLEDLRQRRAEEQLFSRRVARRETLGEAYIKYRKAHQTEILPPVLHFLAFDSIQPLWWDDDEDDLDFDDLLEDVVDDLEAFAIETREAFFEHAVKIRKIAASTTPAIIFPALAVDENNPTDTEVDLVIESLYLTCRRCGKQSRLEGTIDHKSGNCYSYDYYIPYSSLQYDIRSVEFGQKVHVEPKAFVVQKELRKAIEESGKEWSLEELRNGGFFCHGKKWKSHRVGQPEAGFSVAGMYDHLKTGHFVGSFYDNTRLTDAWAAAQKLSKEAQKEEDDEPDPVPVHRPYDFYFDSEDEYDSEDSYFDLMMYGYGGPGYGYDSDEY